MYKVFINDSSLSFNNYPKTSTSDCIEFKANFSLEKLIAELENTREEKHLCIYHFDLEILWEEFKSCFKIIEAAGGIVKNEKEQLLLIYRLGLWDLPKGKIEIGEEKKEAAIREVEEECGITDLKILNELPTTMHVYTLKGVRILKFTYWYEMETSFQGDLIPQLEEDILEAKWVEMQGLENYIKETYASIAGLMKYYLKN